MSKEIGEFSLKSTSWTMGDDALSANFEGTATGFGDVVGTLSGRGEPGAEFGTCSWRSSSFLENGDQIQVAGEGTWQAIGKHKWRLRFTHATSDGRTVLADGVLDMPSRSFDGKIFD